MAEAKSGGEAKSGDTVQVHYTGRLDDGTVFDSSQGRDPLQFTLGTNQVIPGFEDAVTGLNEGQSTTTQIPADQAYGERRDDLVLEVERERFPDDINPEVGQRLQLAQPDGSGVPVEVTEVTDETVTLDANHPLAGKDLTFDIELVAIV